MAPPPLSAEAAGTVPGLIRGRSRSVKYRPLLRFLTPNVVTAVGLVILVIGVEAARVIPSLALFALLSVLALRSPLWALRAFTAGILAASLTPAFTQQFVAVDARTSAYVEPTDLGVLLGRYLLMMTCVYKLASAKAPKRRSGPPWTAFLVFIAITALNVLAISYEPLVSGLKLLTMALGVYMVFRFAVVLGREAMQDWFTAFFGAVFVIGMPFMFSPQGYMVNGTGFQGLFNHPQALGVIVGVFSSYLFISLFSPGKAVWGPAALLGVCLISLFLSEARTGMLAFGLSSALFGTIVYFGSRRKFAQKAIVALCVVALGAYAVTSPTVAALIADFVSKGTDGGDIGDLYQESRGQAVTESWIGFLENPIFGVGFGLPHNPEILTIRYDPVFDLPISAAVEKGLIFTATLEELGVFGSIPALVFLLSMLWMALTRVPPQNGALVFAAVLSNVGESTLTSFGGIGAFIWLAIAVGLSQSRVR